MTFEGIFLLLSLWGWVKDLDCNSAFNAAQNITSFIGETPHTTCLIFQTALGDGSKTSTATL